MSVESKLDEKGFVFLGKDNRPYWCAMYFNEPWLFYWHPSNRWVTLKKVTQQEIWMMPHNLSQEHQDLYFKERRNTNDRLKE